MAGNKLNETQGEKTKLLILGGVWPFVTGSREAANVICYEIALGLAKSREFEVRYACVGLRDEGVPPEGEPDLKRLRDEGVDVLGFVGIEDTRRNAGAITRLLGILRATPQALIAGAAQDAQILRSCGDSPPDVVLTIWSELATAAAMNLPLPKLSYYGNPDHKVMQARAAFDWETRARRFSMSAYLRWLRLKALSFLVKRAHLKVMKNYDWIGNVACNDAEFYRAHGLEKVDYIQNLWPATAVLMRPTQCLRTGRENLAVRIVGNVGNLSATGNTHGLWMLGKHILPLLPARLGPREFEVHIFGRGRPHAAIEPLLRRERRIVIRGFVANIDAELLAADVFLVPNNHRKFVVGHTRFLHAWSLGVPVIAFADSAKAMPEIRHRYNALLAETPEEFADLVAEACRDSELRKTLAENARETLRRSFSPAAVTARIRERIKLEAGSHQRANQRRG